MHKFHFSWLNNNNNENEKVNQENLNVYNGNSATGIHIVQIFRVSVSFLFRLFTYFECERNSVSGSPSLQFSDE